MSFLPTRALSRVLMPVVLASLTLVGAATAASASQSSDLLSYTNSARGDHGLRSYAVSADLTRVAQQHAEWMASHKSLEHTSDLGGKVCCWRSVGENIGYGMTAKAVFNAFMGSSTHRGNILSSRFTQIGVGAARASDGYWYFDQVFRQPKGSTSSSTTASAPKPSTGTSSPRASRSAPRAALPSPRVARLTAAEQFSRTLTLRMRQVRSLAGGSDPIARSVSWVQVMSRVTAAR